MNASSNNNSGNKAYVKDLFNGMQKSMLDSLESVRKIVKHGPAKGSYTEKDWINVLDNFLPNRYDITKAFIIDSNDSISEEIDIVVYNKHHSPLFFSKNGINYIPVESVYAIFEVKQDFNKTTFDYAKKKFKSVRGLKPVSGHITDRGKIEKPRPPYEIIGVILTTNTTWRTPFSNPLLKYINQLEDSQKINLGCVLNCGSFLINYKSDVDRISFSNKNDSLITFFLNLWSSLQPIGSSYAIDYTVYRKLLNTN